MTRRRAQQPFVRLVQPAAVDPPGAHQIGRCQRDRDRRSRARDAARNQEVNSRGGRNPYPGGPHPDDPCQRVRHAAHAGDRDRAGDDGGVPVPAARRGDHRRRRHRSAGAGGNLRADVGRGILHQQSVADGAGDLRRLRSRRRHGSVMIENCFRNLEKGMNPVQAAMEGARQIGFTVVSISISLIAAFIPLLFMTGVIGRVFREFSVTLVFAIAISMVVSLTLTPMICAHFVRKPPTPRDLAGPRRRADHGVDGRALRAEPARRAQARRADLAGVRGHHRVDRRDSTSRRRRPGSRRTTPD